MPSGVRAAALVAAVALVLGGCTQRGQLGPTVTPPPVPPPVAFAPGADGMGDSLYPTSGNGGYDVGHYDLDLRYDPGTRILAGTTTISATATADLNRFDLDLHGLTVASATVDGADARPARTGDELVLTPPRNLSRGQQFTVTVRYSGVPTPYQDPETGEQGFVALTDGAVALGEPDVAASWFPVNDHPRDKATYTIRIAAPDGLQTISNGRLTDTRSAAGFTTTTWSVTAPMASYLATMVIGHYRVQQSTHDGQPVIIAVDASLPSTVDAQIGRTPEIVDFLSTQFGPYPFDALGGVVLGDSPIAFALETQTRPVYARGFFAAGADHPSSVIAHELAHQWFGDSVSVNGWADTWLNEGFATYASWLWSEHEGGQTVQAAFERAFLSSDAATWAEPPGNPTRGHVFGTAVYQRGAMTLQALRITVGDQTFFAIVKDWARQKAYGNGSTPDFIALADHDSGRRLEPLFQDWLYGTVEPPAPVPAR